MPQNKRTPPAVDGAELPKLTARQYAYVQNRLRGLGQREAYASAYNNRLKPEHQWVEAWRLENHPKVSQWLAAIRTATVSQGTYTLEAHLSELDLLKREGLASGNIGAAVNAVVSKGKAVGLYVDRVEDVTPQSDYGELLSEIRESLGAAAAEQAARRLGLGKTH